MAARTPRTLALFCRVVDNYGDIGICWRLARQLVREHALAVTLWVDDLASFQRICPALDTGAQRQLLEGVAVQHWAGQEGRYAAAEVADIVVEFFACDIPPGYIEAMAQCMPRPVWLNLEGLTAEDWVEGCHTLPSMHPRLPLTKHFFFPGFSDRTGGLLVESALESERMQFLADRGNAQAFLSALGLQPAEIAARTVSLFCYPHAPVAALFSAWQAGPAALCCLVPEGVARGDVAAFLGSPAIAGAAATRGALTVRVIDFMPQTHYDRLLWSCDVNFVRGEDSFVRAQLAGKPFIWHIYPQDEQLHHKKLRAFLQRYAGRLDGFAGFTLGWNGAPEEARPIASLWQAYADEMADIGARAEQWRLQMQDHGDLASNMLKFATQLALAAGKT